MERPASSASASRASRRSSLHPSSVQSPSPATTRPRQSIVSSGYGRSPSAAGMSPRPPSRLMDDPHEFAVGDLVYVPGGMRGVVLYLGPIHGKVGDFAGVDLLGDDADKGKNNGTVNGVRYFNPSHPSSGIFVSVSKLSVNMPKDGTISAGTPRPSSVMRSRASSRAADRSASPVPSHALHMAPAVNSSGFQTPRRRTSLASMTSGRTSRSAMARPSLLFSPTSVSHSSSNAAQTTTPSTARRKSAIGTGTVSRMSRSSTLAMSSGVSDDDLHSPVKDISGPATDELSTEVASMRRQLEDVTAKLEAKEVEFIQQGNILQDMENTLAEFQTLSDATMKQSSGNENDQPPTQRELDLRTLLQDKEAIIETLTQELDSKRTEFRETMETLERANMASTHMYEAQLEDLRNKVSAATGVVGSIEPLEAMISELEASLDESREVEQRMRDELITIQESTIAKDEEILQLHTRLEQLSLSKSGSEDTAHDHDLANELVEEKRKREKLEQEIVSLERIIESKVFREQELERELVQVREQLSSALDSLNSERSQAEKLEHQTEAVPKSPLKPVSNTSLNGTGTHSKSAGRTTSPVRNVLVCEICGSEGHDIIDCKSGGYGNSAGNGTPMSTVSASGRGSPIKTPGRKLWCALCERDGHSSMDCPYEGISAEF